MIRPTKSPNIMSTTGRMPAIAAPTAIPVKPASEIGVSITRLVPNSSTRPDRTLKGWPASAISSPRMKTRSSRRISSASASLTACPSVNSRSATSGIDVLIHFVDARIRSGDGKLDRLLDLGLHFTVNLIQAPAVGRVPRDQPICQQLYRIALVLPLMLFLLGAVVFAADVAHVVPHVAVRVDHQE